MLKKRIRVKRNHGQGILEVIVAIGIIVMGLVGTLVLIIWTIAIAGVSQSQIIAMNLAREGVEITRGVRDGNWLKIDSGDLAVTWDTGLSGNAFVYTAIPTWSSGTWSLRYDSAITFQNQRSNVYLSGDFYNQYDDVNNHDGVTQYQRILTTRPICRNGGSETVASDGGTCTSPFIKAGVEVTATVQWHEKGRTHTSKIVDRLFDWKT